MNDILLSILTGSGFITGLFSIVLYKLRKADEDRKANQAQADKRMKRIEANTAKLAEHEEIMKDMIAIANELKQATKLNGEGTKVTMRHMLKMYHAEFMAQGYITTDQKTIFLECYQVYEAKGGNGVAVGWKKAIESLPVRDDIPTVSPFLRVLRGDKNEGH